MGVYVPSGVSVADLPVHTVHPGLQTGTAVINANQSVAMRSLGSGVISSLYIWMTSVTTGNVSVGVYSGLNNAPNIRLAVATVPVVANVLSVPLGQSLFVDKSCWLAVGVDTAVTFGAAGGGGGFAATGQIGLGIILLGAYPLPAVWSAGTPLRQDVILCQGF